MDSSRIQTLLSAHSLYDLTMADGRARDALAAIPGEELAAELRTVIVDDSLAHEVRFKACETALSLPSIDLDEAARAAAAMVYAREMGDGATHTIWGLPGRPSSIARHLLGLGEAAVVPALRPLLADQRSLTYEGSQEPTLSRARNYRVADLAGSLLATLLNKPFPADAVDPSTRDRALTELREASWRF